MYVTALRIFCTHLRSGVRFILAVLGEAHISDTGDKCAACGRLTGYRIADKNGSIKSRNPRNTT